MGEKQKDEQPGRNQPVQDYPSALEVVSEYSAALAARDSERMKSLHSPDFVLDWVYADAFENPPRSAEETRSLPFP
jgi:hypothetical protein